MVLIPITCGLETVLWVTPQKRLDGSNQESSASAMIAQNSTLFADSANKFAMYQVGRKRTIEQRAQSRRHSLPIIMMAVSSTIAKQPCGSPTAVN